MDEEGTRLKRMCAALLAALMLALGVCGALAQTEITVYVSQGALERDTARQLLQLMRRAIPEAAFTAVYEEEAQRTLRELVLEDRAPQLAICPAQEALVWAKEGLLLPLDGGTGEARRMARAVRAACAWDANAYVAPLRARHRQVAVNRKLLDEFELHHLLDARAYPVWQPMQMYQVLEEAAIAGGQAMEIWPVASEDSAAILALVQAMYHGLFLAEDGKTWQADGGAAVSGVEWLQAMVDCELIGVAKSRQDALDRFLEGETALFIDWTEEEDAWLRAQGEDAMEIVTVPYPSSSGVPVRSFDVIGAAVFASGDEQADALAAEAASFLAGNTQAQLVLGERAIFDDGATWLHSLSAHEQGPAMRSALCTALDSVLLRGENAEAAMEAVQTMLNALGGQ